MHDPVDEGRTFARMLRASTLALLLEAGVALLVLLVAGPFGEPPPDADTMGGGMYILALPFMAVFAVGLAFAVSAVLVLPVVLLGEDLGRKFGAAPVWWQLSLAGVAGALLAPLAGVAGWVVGWAVLAVAALLTRPARRGYFVSLLVGGSLAVVTVFTAGGVALYVTE
ncbi:hypothetical protein DEJ44_20210 [Streptomyces venezuelae]|uniref:hypothetical protein n=1 Tax=Streptomyces venezuelae TaxID=54571 RepID=UPI00123A0065|nr:hypothetical protein [Streptomyces venezuelae]QES07696.1 hypothetical protein DEJ44_20210 [Streptomyces venezuelae]